MVTISLSELFQGTKSYLLLLTQLTLLNLVIYIKKEKRKLLYK